MKTATKAPRIRNAAFDLLKELHENNERGWFTAHREELRRTVQAPFAAHLVAASERLFESGNGMLAGARLKGGPGTMFRMQRDARFLGGRPPFHPHVEGVLTRDGCRIGARAALQVRLDRGGGFLGAGSFRQPPGARLALRSAMVAREARFKKVVDNLAANGLRVVSDSSLSRCPRGFESSANSWLRSYLAMNEPVVRLPLSRSAWTRGQVVDRIDAFASHARPFLLFHLEALRDVQDAVIRPPRARSRKVQG